MTRVVVGTEGKQSFTFQAPLIFGCSTYNDIVVSSLGGNNLTLNENNSRQSEKRKRISFEKC